MEKAAAVTLILTVLLILLRGKCAGVEVYGAFLSGAKKGMEAAWQLLPALTGMLLMLSLMNASGLTALLVRLLSPLTAILNLPQEVAPMLILRPMTGSGSLAALQEIFAQYGADSRVGRIASVLMGSSETIFYTMSVYLGAAGVKKLCEQGVLGENDTVVSVVTGNGLKDVANAIKSAGEPIHIAPDLELMVEEFKKRGVTVE